MSESRLECSYPVRDRKTKVGQRYLDNLLEENKRLSALVSSIGTPGATPPQGSDHVEAAPRADNADRNPVLDERPWFIGINAVDLPIHIGEAADAAFATRLRQAASTKQVSHFPRVHYMTDDALRTLSETPPAWPSPARIRFLIDVALKTISRTWHIVRKSTILQDVQKLLTDPKQCNWLTTCRIWVLMAIGEGYSSRCTLPDQPFPGAQYWARAMQMTHMPAERPRLDLVEVYLLLSFYAASMNRRHTSILLASHALRISVILGLHIEIGESQLRDPAIREHRCRLWWTAYRFDRLWASKIGWPPSIPDDSIEIGLPSDEGLPPAARGDFEDAQYMIMSIKMARMLNHAVTTLYVRKRQPTSFSERVQVAVRALRDWADDLPEHLKLNTDELPVTVEPHVLYLHLAFNQAVIVVTRPILLHLFRQRHPRSATDSHSLQPFSDSALSLTTACIRCARQSIVLLKRSWTDGTFPTFDYFHMQFLFSSATILAISALLQSPGWTNDREDFLLGCSFLQQLERNGNFGAKEFSLHMEALKTTLREHLDDAMHLPPVPTMFNNVPTPQPPLPNPPLQDFLNHPEIDLDFMDTGGQWVEWQDIFWPEEIDSYPG
ncbi:Proline utilization trans-activator [Pseudocercospora fuligena]|uniref:Proline utilization trans-activator n=1 Tax=Pseudocercospora fuligena TaxID=685502 RepID=A0A8H6R8D7_9PEZI|nr:Proline utilization trans-activator [Pseudocercospora fuligena]